MCDLDTQKDAEEFINSDGKLSRRKFTMLTATASAAMLLPPVANAQSVTESDVNITLRAQ